MTFDALATASAAGKPLDAVNLELQEGHFLMDGLPERQHQRFGNVIQRRRDFALAAGEVVQHTARNLQNQITGESGASMGLPRSSWKSCTRK